MEPMLTLHPDEARLAEKNRLPRLVTVVDTPFGAMTLVERGPYLSEARLSQDVREGETLTRTPLLARAAEQLAAYFAGERTAFDLPLAPLGTPFQHRVWQTLLREVPFGQSISYGELAKRCDNPAGARAVGMANHHNPLAILIPCHRVLGANGGLVGYGGGLPVKRFLLTLERVPFRP